METQEKPADSNDDGPQQESPEPDNVRIAREYLEDLRLRLDETTEKDPKRYVILYQVAVAMGNYHDAADINGEGELPFGLELLAKAERLAPEAKDIAEMDDNYCGMAINTQMTICNSLFQSTNDPNWLHKGIEHGERLMLYMEDTRDYMNAALYRMLYSNRCERLAKAYYDLYTHSDATSDGTLMQHAVRSQGIAVDHTIPYEWASGGELKKHNRFLTFLDMKVEQLSSGIGEDQNWDALVDLTNSFPHNISMEDNEEARISTRNYFEYLCILARRWADTRQDNHLDELLDHAQEYCKHLKKNDTLFDDGSRELFLHVAAEQFSSWTDESSRWARHIPSIDVAIALWQKLRPEGIATVGDIYKHGTPVAYLIGLYERRYDMTKKAADGWTYDDLATISSRLNAATSLLKALDRDGESAKSHKPWFPDPESTSMNYKTSIIGLRTTMICDKPSFDFSSHRLQFVIVNDDKNWRPTIENWVRERTDDGEYLLGGAVEGRDDDVIEYVRNWDNSSSKKAEKLIDHQSEG